MLNKLFLVFFRIVKQTFKGFHIFHLLDISLKVKPREPDFDLRHTAQQIKQLGFKQLTYVDEDDKTNAQGF